MAAHATQPAALVAHWDVAQAAVALRPPLSPAALGPFGLMLLSVAVLPLWHPHWWDDNANRLKVLRWLVSVTGVRNMSGVVDPLRPEVLRPHVLDSAAVLHGETFAAYAFGHDVWAQHHFISRFCLLNLLLTHDLYRTALSLQCLHEALTRHLVLFRLSLPSDTS